MYAQTQGQVFTMTDEERDTVLWYGEGDFGDVKGKCIRPNKMSESIAAFANTDGGELWIGISENSDRSERWWDGFSTKEDANAHIFVLTNLLEIGTHYSFDYLQHGQSNGYVLHIDIGKSGSIIRATNGIAYIRRGAQNVPVSSDAMLRQLERNKGITSYETETVRADPATITNSNATIGFMLTVVPNAEPEEWMRKNQMIVGDKPTVAGVLLFSDDPQAILPKRSGVKISRYTGTKSEGSRETLVDDPISIEGNIYDLIHSAVGKTQEIIGNIKTLGERGFEIVSYPPATLHEIVTNAVLHRDYSIRDDIHVRIFDNRVEVESPGTLPGHITEKNILKERLARNGAIVRLINKFHNPPNKDIGEGLRAAFSAMKEMQLREPEIRQSEHSVTVFIRHTRLASHEDAVIEYLQTHSEITNTQGRELTGLHSENSMKNVFVKLRDKDMIEPVPGKAGRSSAWRLVIRPYPKPEEKLIQGRLLPPVDGVSKG